VFAVADDPNAYVAWTVQRDGLLRMRTSSNVRHVGLDPNDPLTLASFAYDRAVMGLPEGETVTPVLSPAQPRRFDYDPLDRLIRVTYGTDPNRTPDPNTDPREAFNLDLAGNGIDYEDRQGNTTHYEPNAGNESNQYTEITPGVTDPNYDAAGNLTVDHRGYEYEYDHDNHLTKVRRSTTTLVTFEYDALGRRMFMTDWTATPIEYRQYIYSGQNVVEEYDLPQHRACYYVHGPSYTDERVLMYDEASEGDYIYLLEDLYTVAGLADARGWLVEAYDYDAYGKVTMRRCAVLPDAADYDADGDVDDADLAVFDAHENGPGNDPCDVTDPCMIPGWRSDFDGDGDVDGVDYIVFAHAYGGAGVSPRGDRMLLSGPMSASRVANPYFFTGRRLDLLDIDDANTPNHFADDTARLPLYYYRARTMDPVVGRFLQRDPAGNFLGTMNLFEYGSGVPCAVVDPYGLKDYKLGTADPTVTPDAGAGPWGSQQPTLRRIALRQMAINFIIKYVQPFLPNAAAHLLHYFGNSGLSMTIDLASMIQDVPSARKLYAKEFSEAVAFVESLQEGDHHITSGAASEGYNTEDESMDWFLAVGGYDAWGKGPAKVYCRDGKRCYELTFVYKMVDRYNWDIGKTAPVGGVLVPDVFMGEWHLQGLAKEFGVSGSVTKTAHWCDGDPRPPGGAPGPGGGGGGR